MSERNRLFLARKRRGLTLGQVQEYIGINASRLSRLERDIGQPTPETLDQLADLYGVSVDWLRKRTDDPAQPVRTRIAENGAAYVTWSPPPALWLDELADIARTMSARARHPHRPRPHPGARR